MATKNEEIGLRVKELRESLSLTRVEFADKIGLDNSTLGKVEKGSLGLSKDALLEIISKFNVSYTWLFDGVGSINARTIEDTPNSLLVTIYASLLEVKAREEANSEFIKKVYQMVSGKDTQLVIDEFETVLSRFLAAAQEGHR